MNLNVINQLRRGVWLALAAAMGVPGAVIAQDAGTLALAPGIVVDVNRDLAFAISPEGGTQAIVLADGRISWASAEPMLPLAIQDGRLLALASTRQPGLGMLLIIDPASGNAVDRVAFDLPESVSAEFLPGPNRLFTVQIADAGDGLRLYWRYESRPLRGAVEIDEQGVANPIQVETGAVDVSYGGDRAYATPVRVAVTPPALPNPAATAEERLPNVNGEQFVAADRAYVLGSVAFEDDRQGYRYRWSIHDRRNGQSLGNLTSSYALAPFLVNRDRLVYRAEAEGRRAADGEWVSDGPRLVGYDLRGERQLWSVPVNAMVYRGPLPP